MPLLKEINLSDDIWILSMAKTVRQVPVKPVFDWLQTEADRGWLIRHVYVVMTCFRCCQHPGYPLGFAPQDLLATVWMGEKSQSQRFLQSTRLSSKPLRRNASEWSIRKSVHTMVRV